MRPPGAARPGDRPTALPERGRVVVKVGSSSLTRGDGGLDLNRIDILAGLVARMRARGHGVVLVSSGAVAAGLVPLGLGSRPSELSLLQAAASVGQGRLIGRWQTAMSAYGVVTAQVLLTAIGLVLLEVGVGMVAAVVATHPWTAVAAERGVRSTTRRAGAAVEQAREMIGRSRQHGGGHEDDEDMSDDDTITDQARKDPHDE